MAVRLEKEQNGGEAIVIDGWQNGIAPDPYSGLNYMLGVDLETPGEVAVGYGLTANTVSGATLGDPIARSTSWNSYGSQSPAGSPQFFAILDDNGQVFQSSSITGTFTYLSTGVTLTGATAKDGIAYWLGYLFKTRGANIDYYNGTTWVNGWVTTLNSGVKHCLHVGTDNVLYITNGNFVASITLADPSDPSTFDPTNASTYTVAVEKLQLPAYEESLSLTEVGGGNTPNSTLLVGGVQNAIYPWDKTSPTFALPIYLGESYIKNMVSVNQNAFIFPGNQSGRGRIFITNGSQADVFFKIPDYIFGEQDPYYNWGDAIFHRNNLLFSFFPVKNSETGLIQSFGYVWALDLVDKKFRAISALPSTSSFTSNASCLIAGYGLSVPGFNFVAGVTDNSTTPSINYSGTTAGIGSGSVLTDLIPIGTFLQKKTFTQVEFKLRTALKSGESISITPISDGVLSSTLSFQPTVATGSLSGVANVTFQGSQWLQFLVSLTGNSASSGCRLKEIRIR